MRRVLMISALLAGVMAFGSMPASAGVSVDVHFGHRSPVVYVGDPVDYDPAPVAYVEAGDACATPGARYDERADVRWDARGRWSREQFQMRHGRHGEFGRGRGWDKRDARFRGDDQGRGDGRWGRDN